MTETFSERLIRKKVVLTIWAVAGLAATLIYTVYSKPTWEAKTTILFAPSTPSFANLSGAAAAAAQSASSAFGGPSILRINKMLLESERTLEYVRGQAKLPGDVVDQRSKLRAARDITTDQGSNTLTLAVKARSPEEAQRISHLYIRSLLGTTKAFSLQRSTSEVAALESSLKDKQRELNKAADALQKFQESSKTALTLVALGQGDNASPLATPGPWQSNLRAAEIELSNAKEGLDQLQGDANKTLNVSEKLPTYVVFTEKLRQNVINYQTNVRMMENRLGPAAPELIRAKRDLGVAEEQLATEVNRYRTSLGLGTADAALTQAALKEAQLQGNVNAYRQLSAAAPGEAKQYMNLVRRVALLSSITMKFEAQLTVARLSEGNDPNRWNIVDDAVVGDKPSNKNFPRNGLIGLVAGLLGGCLAVAVFDRRRKPVSVLV